VVEVAGGQARQCGLGLLQQRQELLALLGVEVFGEPLLDAVTGRPEVGTLPASC